ncbi:MAG: hypothetical protein QM770_11450 [Tepidisphaeraceae bacterium]
MLSLEHLSFARAALIFVALAVPIVLLGLRSMAGLGPVRRWVALGARLFVLLLLVLLLAGVRWSRTNKDVQVIVVRDVSGSTTLVRDYPGDSLTSALNKYITDEFKADPDRKPDDRIGLIRFDSQAYFDADPSNRLDFGARATRATTSGTDVSSALQLALARAANDAMNRIVLVWDGNATQGDLDAALRRAAAAHIPIDVLPLNYQAEGEVIVERIAAPTWRKENEPFGIDIVLRSTNPGKVSGRLMLMHQGQPLKIGDADASGAKRVTLNPGPPNGSGRTVEHVQVPALNSGGVHQFETLFFPDTANVGGKPVPVGDTIADNNRATAFTFVRGKGSVLYIDGVAGGGGTTLRNALVQEGIVFDDNRLSVDQFPTTLVELQNYDAVVLNNVSKGTGGLSDLQEQLLTSYVKDMGGGLLMVGGPNTLGAGGWSGSRLEEILPLNMDVPAKRMIPKGALVLVMHACEMPEGNFWGVQCGIKAVEALSPRDEIGVISYGWKGGVAGKSVWDHPLSERGDGMRPIASLKNMQAGDMPSFEDSMNLALNGDGTNKGIKDSARSRSTSSSSPTATPALRRRTSCSSTRTRA